MRDHTLGIISEATRWLRVYLDTDLHFRTHKSISLEIGRRAENTVRPLRSRKGLEPGLIRRIQVAGLQPVALYDTEQRR